jgi:tRNA pseudouridine38-40 synthase
MKGLNTALPPEIRVYRAAEVPSEFHARYACTGKTYRYFLHMGPVVPPPLAPFVWMWQGPLEERAMAEAAGLFLGEHDFSAFTTAEGRERNIRRTLTACGLERRGPLLVLTVEGPSFLHRMVRCIAGAITAAGTGRLERRHLSAALAGDTSVLLHALPSQALHLWEVWYPEDAGDGSCAGWPGAPSWVLES